MKILSKTEFFRTYGTWRFQSLNGNPTHISEGAAFVVCGAVYTPVDDYHAYDKELQHRVVVRKNNLYYVGEFNYARLEPTKKYLELIYNGVDYIQAMEFMDL